jgi:hypothetical protein
MTSLVALSGYDQADSGDETDRGVSRQIKVEVRKKLTFVRRDAILPAEAKVGDDPLPTASQPMSIEVPTDAVIELKSELEVHNASPLQNRRHRRRSVQPDYVDVHHKHTSVRVTLRVLHSAYRSLHTNSRTYGYAHFCAGYVRWLINLPDSVSK